MAKKKYDEDNYDEEYEDKYDGGSAKVSRKVRIIAIASAAAVFLVALIVAIVLLVNSCSSSIGGETYDIEYKSVTSVGYYSTQIGTTKRVKPVAETKNEGLNEYPEYGKNLQSVIGDSAEQKAKRDALINEASYLTTTNTWNGGGGGYTWMDEQGYLYSGTREAPEKTLDKNGNHRQLYKHSASVGLYGGDVADNEPALIKSVTLNPRKYSSYSVTGLYAPAGEVIKIEISEEDMNATGGLEIHIGQALYNGKANNIWTDKNQMQRFPIILNTMKVNKDTAVLKDGVYTAYVGSFLGGPIYIRNTKETFTATISGGVAYSHFILGYTTKKEFEQNLKSSAPYFDLEVRNYGVLHSGPRKYADKYSYDELYKVAILWEKVSLVSTTNSLQGIVFIYDPFVAAGAAVAFPGQMSVNCPMDWMDGSLNYEGLVTTGSWGNFHEYHHNFQGYGVGDGGEVTNNGMNLVSYALFTKISALRNVGNFGGAGMDGWNRYTSATWALEQVLKIARDGENPENGNRGLALYATLLHNFGPDNYIQAKVKQQKTGDYAENYYGYMRAWQDITHNNMYYYFNDILKGNDLQNNAPSEYPYFVPVSSVYQTGRSYMYDGQKKYITTMQPYVIPMGEDFTVDLNRYTTSNGQYTGGSIVLPEGFTYKIKNVTSPANGQLTNSGNGLYTYTPDTNHLRSGEIIVTLEISGPVKVDDVDLVLQFEQTREHNKNMLERTTYTYNSAVYTDAVEAFKAGYKGYTEAVKTNNVNRTQNCNTDIWYTNQEGDVMPDNAVVELEGKIYVDESAKYRIAIRGRWNVALYVAINDSNDYKLAGHYVQTNTADYNFSNDAETYSDYNLSAGDWVKFKAVMITGSSGSRASFIGVGWGKFTPAEGTIDENGQLVGGTSETIKVSYASAYRMSYEFPTQKFETDYFYTRDYTYDYKDNVKQTVNEPENTTLADTNYSESIAWNKNDHKIENLFDGSKDTYIHTNGNLKLSKSSTLNFTLDLGAVKPVNRIVFYTQYRPNGDWHCVKSFNLYGSTDGNKYTLIGTFENVARNNTTVLANFEETNIRYCKVEIFESTGAYIILSEIELWRIFEVNGGNQLSPSNEIFKYEKAWTGKQTYSTFGHVYVGEKKSKVSFEFEGTRIAILSSKNFKTDFTVYIDGKKVSSVDLKEDESGIYVSYMSQKLDSGKHKVEIKCNGEANIDSVVTFNEK